MVYLYLFLALFLGLLIYLDLFLALFLGLLIYLDLFLALIIFRKGILYGWVMRNI